jgi:shikimate dehydrogenase
MRRLRRGAVIFDMIYAPVETVMLRQARAAGLRVANGRAMIVGQAVEAFVRHICARELARRGLDAEAIRDMVRGAMVESWPG